jgi:4-hydroxy-tetrahydrodipicolinate synthase
MRQYTDRAFAGKADEARTVRNSLDTVRKSLKSTRPAEKPQAHAKYWQELLGQAGGPVRRPLLPLTTAEKTAIQAALEACGLNLTMPKKSVA